MKKSSQNTLFNSCHDEEKLQNHLNEIPEEMTPKRDLWAGIEHAIENSNQQESQQNQSRRLQFNTPLAWAASVIIAVLVSWQLNQSFSTQNAAKVVQQNSTTPMLGFNAVNFIQTNFQQQKQSLLTSYGKPDLKQLPLKMQQELQQLAKAQQSIVKALAKEKNNQNLLNLLQWTQQQELKLLAQLYRPRWQTI